MPYPNDAKSIDAAILSLLGRGRDSEPHPQSAERFPDQPIDRAYYGVAAAAPGVGHPLAEDDPSRTSRARGYRDLYGSQIYSPTIDILLPTTAGGSPVHTPLVGGAPVARIVGEARISAMMESPGAGMAPAYSVAEGDQCIGRRKAGDSWPIAGQRINVIPSSRVSDDSFVADWAVAASHIATRRVPSVLTTAETSRYATSFISTRATPDSFKNTLLEQAEKRK